MLVFECQWLDHSGKPFATTNVAKSDLSAAVRYAGRRLVSPGSNPRSEGPGRRHPSAEAHGVFVRVRP